MTVYQSSTPSQIINTSRAATLPTIDIPEDVRFERGCIRFQLITDAGTICVETGGRRIECRGTFDALKAHSLVREEWMPGTPGNNRTRQAVIFDENGARLSFGRGKKLKEPHIVIMVSGKNFAVIVPATEGQFARMKSLFDDEQRKRERAAETEKDKPMSADEAHKFAVSLVGNEFSFVEGVLQRRGFKLGASSLSMIKRISELLREAVANAEVIPERLETDGNIIMFPRQFKTAS